MVTVARLRRRARDEASQGLFRALATEAAADVRAADATRQIADETAAASSLSGDDAMVEAFAAWLPGARQHAVNTRAACDRAGAEVSRMRAVLAVSRAAVEAVETLLSQRAEAMAKDHARREQSELDEIGRGPGPE
jgi:flagellar export protein FliJ